MVGIQQAFRPRPLDRLGQLPSQIHRILHAGLQTLSTVRSAHVCGVAGQQHPSIAVDAQFRRLGHLDLGEQTSRRRIPSGELDAGCLTDQTASSVAPDEIVRPQRLAVGQLDIHAAVVLSETGRLTLAIDRHRQLRHPASQYAFDVVLPQPKHVGVPSGKVADVQPSPGEPCDLSHLSLREEPIGDSALIEDFDRPCVQTACP
jgi:hypothetical protein